MSKETNGKESEVKVAEDKHPLMKFVPIVFRSFEEWLAKWNETNYLAERLGLLHSLTSKNGWWSESELVSLLLSVADGCVNESFIVERRYGLCGQQPEAESRKSIANKAFSVLCLKFFRKERNEEPSWWWMLEQEVLFQKVLWFLRRRPHVSNRLYNCSCICDSSDHQQGIFRNFLREFSRLGWDFHCPESRRRWDETARNLVKQRFVTARPQLIDVLCQLGELNWLNGKDLKLDAKSIKKLTEIALSDSLFLPPERVSDGLHSLRNPRNLEEAVLGGSVAAQVVLLYQIKEDKRSSIRALYEASVKQRDERLRVAELDNIKKEKVKLDTRARSLAESSKQ